MADATTARSDDASRSEPYCPRHRQRGTHNIDFTDHSFNGLPDITMGRTLADAIARLDWIAAYHLDRYGREWLDEMRDIGLTVQRVRSEDGPALTIGYPCDGQVEERMARGKWLALHFMAMIDGRELILSELERSGSVYGHMFRVAEGR